MESQEQLESVYLGIILKYDNKKYPYFIMTDFGDDFPRNLSCYEIADIIRKGKVVRKGTLEDHEYSCCYYNFKTKKSAESFVKRLSKFIYKYNLKK